MVALATGPDDTFEVEGGIAEVVTLIVTREQRSTGVGAALLQAGEAIARSRGFDTLKIAVMRGNTRAQGFYEPTGIRSARTFSIDGSPIGNRPTPPITNRRGPSLLVIAITALGVQLAAGLAAVV